MDPSDSIRNLLGTYCELMDAADWPGVGALFAHARLADEHGNAFAQGAGEVERFYASSTILHDGSPRTKHLVLNTIVEIEASAQPARASARSSYLVLQGFDPGELHPMITGRYEDEFATDPDGHWHFAERRFLVDLAGDLSRHLDLEL